MEEDEKEDEEVDLLEYLALIRLKPVRSRSQRLRQWASTFRASRASRSLFATVVALLS